MPVARLTDPQTSVEAALSVKNVGKVQKVILQILMEPNCDEDLQVLYNDRVARGLAPLASQSGVRTRRAELVELGYVVNTGRKAKLISGRSAIVWATSVAGWDFVGDE